MNHRLNWSTEARVAAFHKCGLSALMAMGIVRRSLALVNRSNGNIHLADSPCNGHESRASF